LEGSRVEAEALLIVAIAFRKTNELYAYDNARNKFMVFKSDNTPNNGYHSYHPIDQNEIDDEVKEFLLGE
jgi:hypothetical protein